MTLTCREFSRLIASDAIAELSVRRRLEVRVHAWLCRHCRRYREQILSLGPEARRVWQSPAEDAAGTDALARSILDRIAGSQSDAGPGDGDDTGDGA